MGWVAITTDFTNWELFKDGNVLKVWMYLLTHTNYEDSYTSDGRLIKAGQVVYSTRGIAEKCGMSVQEVKTALKKLVATRSLTQFATHRYTVGTLVNWAKYRPKQENATHEATHSPTTSNKYKQKKKEPKLDFGHRGLVQNYEGT